MTHVRLADTELSRLLTRLPAGLDLDATARASGALVRKRAVKNAADLLHLALGYGACGLSLRLEAAWAQLRGLAQLSDVALLNRLRGAADWLGQILAAILSDRVRGSPRAGGRVVRVIDATSLSQPGSRTSDWRVHVSCRLGPQPVIEQVVLSDGRGAESLQRFVGAPGEIALVDRGYAKADDLAAWRAQGRAFIVRTGWNALRLRTPEGGVFDLFAALDRMGEQASAEWPVAIARDRAARQLLPVRLIALRLSEAQAEQSRRRARAKSRRQGKTLQPQTLRAAGYVLLLSSLEAEVGADEVLALYRLRWQIELVFKRLKSLLHLDALPAKDPDLARCWIYAKLIAALLLEETIQLFFDSPPWAEREGAPGAVAVAGAAAAA